MAKTVKTRSPTDFDREVGRRITHMMTEAGMTQKQMGEAVGVTFQQIQKYCSGGNRLPLERFTRICSALRVPPSVILEGLA